MGRLKWLLVILLVGGLTVLHLAQREIIGRLRSENAALRAAAEEAASLREENAQLAQARTDPAELERLRNGQQELVRLRGQVAQLRRQLADASVRPAAPVANPAPPPPVEAAPPPVETFSASLRVAVPWQQTLVTGGWLLPSGKRALMFVQPLEVEQADQVMLQARLIEVPDATLTQLGMDGMRANSRQSSVQGLLTVEETESVLKVLQSVEGVNVLAAPRVSTANGQQARVNVAETKKTPSGESYEVGPAIDVTPRIAADRGSVDLTISAQLKLPTASPR